MSLPRQYSTGSEGQGSIVKTNCDIKASFEELFGVLNQPPSDRGKGWTDRNLPNSFYTEPSDSRHGTRSPSGSGIRQQSPKRTASGLQVLHSRSVSSPANLVQSLSIKTTPQHSKQSSFDGYLDSAQSSAEVMGNQQQSAWPEAASVKYPRYSTDSAALSNENTTSLLQQNVGAMPSNASHSFQEFSSPDSLPLAPGWDRGVSPEGEVYYIDHNTKSTSWTHPALIHARTSAVQHYPPVQQRSTLEASHLMQAESLAAAASGVEGKRSSSNEHLIQLQLQQLQKEKLRILRDQEAILMKERQLAEMMRRSAVISSPTPPAADSMLAMNRPPLSNLSTGHDTYQMHHAIHVRQSSGDSGLGGMGAAYSLSRTPDDFLCNVDEGMDIHEGYPRPMQFYDAIGPVASYDSCSSPGRPLDKMLSLNTTETGLFGAPMDFGNLLDPALDSDQVASAFNNIHGDMVDIDMQTGGQTWL